MKQWPYLVMDLLLIPIKMVKTFQSSVSSVSSVLLHCNVVHNDHLQNSKLLYSFVRNNSFGKSRSVQSQELIRTKTTDSVFDYIEI